MKKYLVTGGLGFIGSHLTKKLIQEKDTVVFVVDDLSNPSSDVTELSSSHRNIMCPLLEIYSWEDDSKRPELVFVEGDCGHKSITNMISEGCFDAVFHLAAKPRVEWSVQNPVESTNQNFINTIKLAGAAAKGKTKFIFSSTSAVYGDGVNLPTSECSPTTPQNPYGAAKLCSEEYLRLFESLYGLDWVALRYFNVYGPGQLGSSPYCTAIAAWCHKSKAEEPLRSDGDGEQSRDMVYVEDIADANITIANQHIQSVHKCRIYNIGTGSSYTNNEILEHFALKGYTNVTNAPARPGDVRHTLADNEKMLLDFNWSPSVNLLEGLKKTFLWWGI